MLPVAVRLCDHCFTISVAYQHFANAHPVLAVVNFSWEKDRQLEQGKQTSPPDEKTTLNRILYYTSFTVTAR